MTVFTVFTTEKVNGLQLRGCGRLTPISKSSEAGQLIFSIHNFSSLTIKTSLASSFSQNTYLYLHLLPLKYKILTSCDHKLDHGRIECRLRRIWTLDRKPKIPTICANQCKIGMYLKDINFIVWMKQTPWFFLHHQEHSKQEMF